MQDVALIGGLRCWCFESVLYKITAYDVNVNHKMTEIQHVYKAGLMITFRHCRQQAIEQVTWAYTCRSKRLA